MKLVLLTIQVVKEETPNSPKVKSNVNYLRVYALYVRDDDPIKSL